LKTTLLELIGKDKLLKCFDHLKKNISEKSDIAKMIILLNSRFSATKLDTIKGIISKEEEIQQENTLRHDLIQLIELIEPEDLKEENIAISINMLLAQIQQQQNALKVNAQEKKEGLTQMANSLMKLANLVGEKPPPESGVSLVDWINSGVKKGNRRLKIGMMQIKELRRSQLQIFRNMANGYANLVEYLDFPEEQINQQQREHIKLETTHLNRYVTNLEENTNPDYVQFKNIKKMFGELVVLKSKVGPEFNSYFESMGMIEAGLDEILIFIEKNILELDGVKNTLKELLSELKINIQEWS